MIILAIVLTWACPSGALHKTQSSYAYPKDLDKAMAKYEALDATVNVATKEFNGELCLLTDIKGGHRKVKKAVK
jgi:uncharacterized ion transporter superfamily protein YfcC